MLNGKHLKLMQIVLKTNFILMNNCNLKVIKLTQA